MVKEVTLTLSVWEARLVIEAVNALATLRHNRGEYETVPMLNTLVGKLTNQVLDAIKEGGPQNDRAKLMP